MLGWVVKYSHCCCCFGCLRFELSCCRRCHSTTLIRSVQPPKLLSKAETLPVHLYRGTTTIGVAVVLVVYGYCGLVVVGRLNTALMLPVLPRQLTPESTTLPVHSYMGTTAIGVAFVSVFHGLTHLVVVGPPPQDIYGQYSTPSCPHSPKPCQYTCTTVPPLWPLLLSPLSTV